MQERSDIWDGRAILHVDMDAFFAAVEQLDHPEWRGKPVIVGGSPSGRGVVSTASYEARRYGVCSAMPSARAVRLCPDAIWVPPRFERYHEISLAVFEILDSVSPHVEQVSVDEGYVDVTPGRIEPEDPVETAFRIQEAVATLGVTCSIGVATSKTVAKIASDFRKPEGLTVVRPGQEAEFLAPLPVTALPGVGQKSASRLSSVGVKTLEALAALDEEDAVHLLGSAGADLVRRARGEDPRPVRDPRRAKSVSNERTFPEDVRDPEAVHTALLSLVDRVGWRLRRKGLAGKTVTLKVRFSDFTTKTAQRTLDHPVCDDPSIAEVALELLDDLWSEGVGIRLIGVGVSRFGEAVQQMDLFGESATDDRRTDAVRKGVDAVRERFGVDAIRRGMRIRPPRERDR